MGQAEPPRGARADQSASGGHPGVRGAGDEWAVALLQAIGEGLCLVMPSGEVVWANERFRSLDAQTRARISDAAMNAAEQFASGDAGNDGAQIRADMVSYDQSATYEVYVSEVGPSYGTGPRQGDERLAVVVRDVTAPRRAKQRMDAIDRAGSELMRLDAELVRSLNAMERLKFLEGKIVRYTQDLLHFDHFGIRLLNHASGRLELVISCNLPPEFDSFDIYPLPEGNGISGYVAATGKSYICQDTSTDELFLPGLTGARSSLTVPLMLHDKVIGIMDVESLQPRAFNDDDRQLAEIFGRYIAMALQTLDLLVVERSATNKSVTTRVEGELAEPLADIVREIDLVRTDPDCDSDMSRHLDRIRTDVDAIRQRVRDVSAGPQSLLGVERALADKTRDPVLAEKRVLVADDEPKIRRIIGDVLRNRGCHVVVVDSGSRAIEAMDAATSKSDAPFGFDLIISDIKMPDRNGYEVFAGARKHSAVVPVILMTGFGYDPHHSIVRASQEGLQAVLFKPFQVEKLVDEVRKALTTLDLGAI